MHKYVATTDLLAQNCELVRVACFWGYANRNCRLNCDYFLPALWIAVPKYLSAVPLAFIRRYFRKCWRLMQAYHLGAGFKLAQHATEVHDPARRLSPA